jgi:hypothetical protein
MKSVLTATALFEGATGLALIAIPSTIVPILLGIPFSDDNLHVVSGITGAALVSLAIACWMARNNGPQAALIVKPMLCYNVIAVLILLYAALGLRLMGMGLWPAIVVHIGLAAWCIVALQKYGKQKQL